MDAPRSHAIANVEKLWMNKSEIYQTDHIRFPLSNSPPLPVIVCHCPCLEKISKRKNSGSTATLRIIITSEVICKLMNSATIHQLNVYLVYPREQLTAKESYIRNN